MTSKCHWNGNCSEVLRSCASKCFDCTSRVYRSILPWQPQFVEQQNSTAWCLHLTNPLQHVALFIRAAFDFGSSCYNILSRNLAAFNCLDLMVWWRFCEHFSHMDNVVNTRFRLLCAAISSCCAYILCTCNLGACTHTHTQNISVPPGHWVTVGQLLETWRNHIRRFIIVPLSHLAAS